MRNKSILTDLEHQAFDDFKLAERALNSFESGSCKSKRFIPELVNYLQLLSSGVIFLVETLNTYQEISKEYEIRYLLKKLNIKNPNNDHPYSITLFSDGSGHIEGTNNKYCCWDTGGLDTAIEELQKLMMIMNN